MSSEKTIDGFAFTCDACGAVWKPPRLGRGSAPRDWDECFAEAKAAGWRAVPVRSKSGRTDWQHRCPKPECG